MPSLFLGFRKEKGEPAIHTLRSGPNREHLFEEQKVPPHATPREKSAYSLILDRYLEQLDGIRNSVPIIMMLLPHYSQFIFKTEVLEHVKQHGTLEDEMADLEVFEIDDHLIPHIDRAVKRINSVTEFRTVAPGIFTNGLVSIYDGFLGHILRQAFTLKPEVLNSSEKMLTFKDLLTFSSVEEARNSVAEIEIDSVLRRSHQQQLEWANSRFGVDIVKYYPDINHFYEICERRNLFTHNDGLINAQYVEFLKQYKLPIEGVNVGEALHVTPAYINKAIDIFYDLGVRLVHFFWRKTGEDDAEAVGVLNEVAYQLIYAGRYQLARSILEFGAELKKHPSDRTRRMMIINLANTLRLQGEPGAKELLAKEDWSATSHDFQLAVASLNEDWKEAVSIMESIGPSGAIGKFEYWNWPVFSGLIETDEFKTAYESIFGEKPERPSSTIGARPRKDMTDLEKNESEADTQER